MKDTRQAFIWITEILQKHGIPYHIAGGLAANIYGAKRKLADIDIEIPEDKFPEILPEVKEYIIYGPQQFKDENWDLVLMTVRYQHQDIDISGAYQAKLYNQTTKLWETEKTNFGDDVVKEVFGIKVPVINKQELIEYKSKLQRVVDIEDITAISTENKI